MMSWPADSRAPVWVALKVGRRTVRATGPMAQAVGHPDPAKVLLDLAVALGLGEDCLPDIAVVRAKPDIWH
jgi:hypothetical protein